MKLTMNKIKKCSYNPRKMSDKARSALSTSMNEFNDISGIVWNKASGELVGGNHRWDELVEKYGKLKFKEINFEGAEDRHLILDEEGHFTGYILRVVDWNEDEEKAANVAANSEKITGDFTGELQNVLKDLKDASSTVAESIFDDLRFDELFFEFDSSNANFDFSEDENFVFDDDEEPEIEVSEKKAKKETKEEDNLDSFGNDLHHTCPQCGYEFQD